MRIALHTILLLAAPMILVVLAMFYRLRIPATHLHRGSMHVFSRTDKTTALSEPGVITPSGGYVPGEPHQQHQCTGMSCTRIQS